MKKITTQLTKVINKTSKNGKEYQLIITEGSEGTENYFCWNELIIEDINAPSEVVIIYDQKGNFKSIKAMRKVTDKELPIETMVK